MKQKRLPGLVLLLLALPVFLITMGSKTYGQNTQDFKIQSFTADYYLNARAKDKVSVMRVEEVIFAEFPDFDQNHGILRAIPETYKNMPLDVSIQSVTDQTGQTPYSYSTSQSGGHLVLKIGDADRYAHGVMSYKIIYTLKNAVSFYDNHDELYWNVNGTQWQQKFDAVTARIHIPASLTTSLQDQQACYSGTYNSTEQNCQTSRDQTDNETVITTKAFNLPVGGNLSFVLGFNKGAFAVDQAALWAKRLKIISAIALGVLPPLTVFVIIYRKWRLIGKDAKSRGVIVPQYVPPTGFNVLTSDFLLNEKLRNQAVTAIIIELAITKYLTIYEINKTGGLLGRKSTTYELELIKLPTDLDSEQATIINMLFGNKPKIGERIDIAVLAKDLYLQVGALGKTVAQSMTAQGYFRTDPVKIRTKYIGLGAACVMAGFFAGGALISTLGFVGVGVLAGLSLSGLITILFGLVMPARTTTGINTHDYLLGLKDYIKLAEADRIKYLQSPAGIKQYGNPSDPKTKLKLFEKLLPYAMIFGLEKDWAKEFKDIYTQPPDWYHGNWSTFNTIYLVSALGGFSTTSATSFSPPQSSNSSGFGGGFSGGGGGGGGGGGW